MNSSDQKWGERGEGRSALPHGKQWMAFCGIKARERNRKHYWNRTLKLVKKARHHRLTPGLATDDEVMLIKAFESLNKMFEGDPEPLFGMQGVVINAWQAYDEVKKTMPEITFAQSLVYILKRFQDGLTDVPNPNLR